MSPRKDKDAPKVGGILGNFLNANKKKEGEETPNLDDVLGIGGDHHHHHPTEVKIDIVKVAFARA